MAQKLLIIRGNSGSGKSTIAKRLQREMGYQTMLIQQDVVRREILRVKDVDDNPSIALIRDMAIYGKHIGYDVIVEGILFGERYGEMLRSLTKEFDEAYVYYLAISFEETLRRHAAKPNAHEFGEAQIRGWWLDKDVLGTKGEKIFTDKASEDEIVSTIRSSFIC